MFRYLFLISLFIVFTAACSPAIQESSSSAVESGEERDDEHDEHKDEHEEHGEDEAGAGERREHGVHEHGTAELTIAWSGSELAVELHTPAYNVVGFEQAPSTEAEEDALARSLETLREGNLLVLNPEAECTVIEAVVSSEMEEEEHSAGEEEGDEETHSEISVSYHFECQRPDEIESLDASELFAQFPNFQRIQTQWVSDSNQSAKDLTAGDAVVLFE